MKTLVIHPHDMTTNFLNIIYSEHDWTVIDTPVSKKYLKEQIKNHDRIIMLGHGTEYGLLSHNNYIIDSALVYLLREKQCVCIWCNADKFVTKYKLTGFYTGMIISEPDECEYCNVNATDKEITTSNILFATAIENAINTDDMLNTALEIYDGDTEVIQYNRNNLYSKNY